MYGLVQAARQWWRKFISILVEEFKFNRSQADACVLIRENEEKSLFYAFMWMMHSWLGIQEPLKKQSTNSNLKFLLRMLDLYLNMLAVQW